MTERKGKKKMGPPRLKLIADNSNLEAEAALEMNPAAAEAVELAHALADVEALPREVEELATQDRREKLRIIEAVLFAASEPLDEKALTAYLAGTGDVSDILAELEAQYAPRGVRLIKVAGKWMFRTADDLSYLLERHAKEERRLSKAALETLAIVAYHQPVTRAEIEDIRGVTISAGTLDILLETGWVRPRGRRRAPGKPITYGTTESFLAHFGLDSVKDLPGLADLKAAGLLDGNLPPGFTVPDPSTVAALMPDELPLEAGDDEDAVQGEMDLPLPDEDETAKSDEGPASA